MRKTVTGLRAWMVQRLSAVYMLLFILFSLIHFAVDPPHSYRAWHGWMMRSSVSIFSAVFFAALLAHAWVGVRDVIMDYVHSVAFRVFLLAALGFGLTAAAMSVMRIFWMGRYATAV
ncbi:MAG: succinate dehydrogenase, hydrophobic membrane anchor protein [Betaproteobacteria bacterium]